MVVLLFAALAAHRGVPATRHSRAVVETVRPSLEQRLAERRLRFGAPMFVRIFKEEHQLEVWLEGELGFELFRTYPICALSGALGPKRREGDQQSPEGFYEVGPDQLNPSSRYFLSFDLGYPNAFDRAQGRTGSALMVHGDCVSLGCYAMTDSGISEIYALAEAALRGGQSSFSVHAFPFRLTSARLAERGDSPWSQFWGDLKRGYDYFELYRMPPRVWLADGRYRVGSAAEPLALPAARAPE